MSLIESMITSDQNDRLSIEQIQQHPWYTLPVDHTERTKLLPLFEVISAIQGQRGAEAEIPE